MKGLFDLQRDRDCSKASKWSGDCFYSKSVCGMTDRAQNSRLDSCFLSVSTFICLFICLFSRYIAVCLWLLAHLSLCKRISLSASLWVCLSVFEFGRLLWNCISLPQHWTPSSFVEQRAPGGERHLLKYMDAISLSRERKEKPLHFVISVRKTFETIIAIFFLQSCLLFFG